MGKDSSTKNDNDTYDETVDDWGLSMDFDLFAKHERHVIKWRMSDEVSDSCVIDCVEKLTLIDMMSLSSGQHDSTGHCVWTGVFFLLAALIQQQDVLLELLFEPKAPGPIKVLELGCGTGLGGIFMSKLFNYYHRQYSTKQTTVHFCLTDADPQALSLCGQNIKLNVNSIDKDVRKTLVVPLKWGEDLTENEGIEPHSWDVVFATDILYDLNLLPQIWRTVKAAMAPPSKDRTSYFVLSHVPRASQYNLHNSEQHNANESFELTALEQHIVQHGASYGFRLFDIVKPEHWATTDHNIEASTLQVLTLTEMKEVEASLMVFVQSITNVI